MFITFEGIDGSGKTTCLNKLKEYIKNNLDINNFIFTREPGGTGIKESELIRNILLDKNNNIDSMTEMLLYLASRKMHVEQLILPSLKNNKIVLCDRFYDSSIVYQGSGRNLGIEKVEKMNLEALNNFKPNHTFYFKIDFETALKRMLANRQDLDRLENEKQDFFKKAIEGYDFLSSRDKERYIVIDATKSPDEVFEQVLNEFKKIIKNS